MVGRKSHLSPACTLFLCGETSGGQTFTEPAIFRMNTSQHHMHVLHRHVSVHVGTVVSKSRRMNFQAFVVDIVLVVLGPGVA